MGPQKFMNRCGDLRKLGMVGIGTLYLWQVDDNNLCVKSSEIWSDSNEAWQIRLLDIKGTMELQELKDKPLSIRGGASIGKNGNVGILVHRSKMKLDKVTSIKESLIDFASFVNKHELLGEEQITDGSIKAYLKHLNKHKS